MSARYAGALRSLDVTPGDRVLVQVDKSPYALLLYLATLRIGAIFVPLNTAYTPTEVTYFLGDARPRLFIARPETEDDLVDIARNTGATLLTFDTDGAGSLADAIANTEPV